MSNLFHPMSDMRCVIRFRLLVPIARGYGDCAKPTGPVRLEQIAREDHRHRQRET